MNTEILDLTFRPNYSCVQIHLPILYIVHSINPIMHCEKQSP